MTTATITPVSGGLALRTPYDPDFVSDFKATVPTTGRRWDGAAKVWLFDPTFRAAVEGLCNRYGYQVRGASAAAPAAPVVAQRLMRVEYIGAPKDRGGGLFAAYGYTDGDWKVVFPHDALRGWFDGGLSDVRGQPAPAEVTFYGLLGLKRGATGDEIKAAHRLMVKRWHPDVNKDADAGEMMTRINQAYAVLASDKLRAKYDAGLALAATLTPAHRQPVKLIDPTFWRPPVRCGWILADGEERLGRFVVTRILQWQDITDAAGRVMVTSWPAGRDSFVTQWV